MMQAVLVSRIGGAMFVWGVIWLGLAGFNPDWAGIGNLLPEVLSHQPAGLFLALAGALIIGVGRFMAHREATGTADDAADETVHDAVRAAPAPRPDLSPPAGARPAALRPAPEPMPAPPKVRVFSPEAAHHHHHH